MNIVYMGTPDFATEPLRALIKSGKHKVTAVVCNHDKPVGRKQVLTPPPVKVLAQEYGIPVYQYSKIRNEGVQDLKNLAPDVIVTCAFGQILSQEIIDIPKYGVINIHASLLPKYRGASPIHYAILNGENQTGITVMRTDAGIDTGDIIISRSTDIKETETCGELFDRLKFIGAEMIITALDLIESGRAKYLKQDESLATYSKIIKKEMALIDFNKSSEQVVNQIRAFNPSPTAFTFLNSEQYKIYSAKQTDGVGEAGEILCATDRLVVACKSGAIEIQTIQKQGGKPLKTADFLRGNKLRVGDKFLKC